MKIELIEEKRHFFKFTSVWLTSLGTTLAAIFEAWPDSATQAWLFLPEDLKAVFPLWTPKALAFSIIFAGIASRLVKQPKLSKSNEQVNPNS